LKKKKKQKRETNKESTGIKKNKKRKYRKKFKKEKLHGPAQHTRPRCATRGPGHTDQPIGAPREGYPGVTYLEADFNYIYMGHVMGSICDMILIHNFMA
jgi:hypothetical protein